MKTIRVNSAIQQVIDTSEVIEIAKEEVINGYLVKSFTNGSQEIALEKLTAVFASPTGKQAIDAIKNGKNSSSHQDRLLAMSSCQQWGDKANVTLDDLSKLRAKEHIAISQLLGKCFQEPEVEISEGENYEITVKFPDNFSVTFRDAKATDIDFIQSTFSKYTLVQNGQETPSLEAFVKVAHRLCIDWNNSDEITESNIVDRPVSNLITFGRVITENFLQST